MSLMNAMMLSCIKATKLIEMREHVRLNFLENVQLHMHTVMCSGCRNYIKHTRRINELLQKKFITNNIKPDTAALEAAIISDLSEQK